MKTSIGFHLSVIIYAAILFVGASSISSVPTHAEGAYPTAKKKAQDAVAKAVKARKCKEAEEAAIEAEAEAAAAKEKVKKAEAAAEEADKDAGNTMEKLAAERSKYREAERARARADKARATAKRLRAEYEAIKKPCDDAEAALAAAEEALRNAEQLLDEKIVESGKTPPKKLVEEKAGLDKLRKDLHPHQGNVIPPSAGQASVVTKSTDGMRVITFDTSAGQIVVNLPDDMRAGDTISGTVVAEPKGNTSDERARNMSALTGYVVELSPRQSQSGGEKTLPTIVAAIFDGGIATDDPLIHAYTMNAPRSSQELVDVNLRQLAPGERPRFGESNFFAMKENETAPGKVVGTTKFEVFDYPGGYVEKEFKMPTLAQQGRPIQIIGPFDGDASNTKLKSSVQDFEKGTENVSGGFGLVRPLVESPRKAAFRNSTNVTGPIELTLNEANKETKGTYRNVGVDLTAPKTSLLKGEKTELKVEVSGLRGIKELVPLTLESRGVITMQGGARQPLVIQPSQVGADGRYSTTRGITGVQAGGWSATATVVVVNGIEIDESLLHFVWEAINMSDEQLDARLADLGHKLEAEGRDNGTETDRYKRLKKELVIFNAERRRRR